MPELEITAIDIGAALLITGIATEILKRILGAVWQPGEARKFAPLLALFSASLAVALVIDLDTANMQDAVLATVVVTAVTVGVHSGTKNVKDGVVSLTRRKAS
jgi:hypothetical protein